MDEMDKMDVFFELCATGKINELKKYYSENLNINIHKGDEYAFGLSCENGRLEVAKWLIELSWNNDIGLINIHAFNEYAFRGSCTP